MKIALIIVGLLVGLFVLNIIIGSILMMINKNEFVKLIEKEKVKIKSADFSTLVSLIGESYKEQEYPAGLLLFSVRYFVARPNELVDFRRGYTGEKKIEKVKEGEQIEAVEIVGSADMYFLSFYGGRDFKEIINKPK